MAEQFYTILTDIGKAKIANSIPLGTKVNFTTLKVGDSNGSYYNPTESQTDLVNTKWESNISSVTTDEINPNWIVIEVIIPGKDGGFVIREAGIFDDEGDMIAIGKYPETYKPIIEDGSTKELLIRIILEVTNAESVVMKIDPTIILATKKEIQILESKMNALIDKFNLHLADNKSHVPYGVATGTANTYAVTLSPVPTAYVDGMAMCVKINVDSTGASTLNVNGLGAKYVKKSNGNNVTNLKANGVYTLRYNSSTGNFILQGEGASGTATASDLLLGKTASTDAGDIVGTILSKGATNYKPSTVNQIISAGQYISGDQTILGYPDLIADNIIAGKNIGDVIGNASIASLGGKQFAQGTLSINATYEEYVSHGDTEISGGSLYLPSNTLPFTPKILVFNFKLVDDVTNYSLKTTIYNMYLGLAIGAIGGREGWDEVNGGTSDSVTTISKYYTQSYPTLNITSAIPITIDYDDHEYATPGSSYIVDWYIYS